MLSKVIITTSIAEGNVFLNTTIISLTKQVFTDVECRYQKLNVETGNSTLHIQIFPADSAAVHPDSFSVSVSLLQISAAFSSV